MILQPYDVEVGAGTFHPATALRALGPEPWRAAYVQPSRRPTDGRYGENPNRLQHYYQFQVILKPAPADSQELYLRQPRGARHRRGAARHPLCRGRLGEPDPGRLGARLGGLARRHGGQPVHLFPAGRRHRMRPGLDRADLRARTAGDVCPGGRERLRSRLQRRRRRPAASPTARCSSAPSASFRNINFELADTGRLFEHFGDAEAECQALIGRGIAAAGL